MSKALHKRRASSLFNESHYEEILHPNEEKELNETADEDDHGPASWATSSFVRWFSLYDENVLRPFFIRKYKKAVMLLEDEYQDLIKQNFDDEDEDEIVDKVETLMQGDKGKSRALSVFEQKLRTISEFNTTNNRKSLGSPLHKQEGISNSIHIPTSTDEF